MSQPFETVLPLGELSIIGMHGCEEITKKIDWYLKQWTCDKDSDHTFIIDAICPRFGTGEGKGVILQSVRGHDVFIICDAFNYGVTFEMYGMQVPMSPDDHFADLKRLIAATNGKARRITVIMPMLYEGRQHKRKYRESLDCAIALQELVDMGVDNIITFDAHDPRIQNAIPLNGFESVPVAYQMLKRLTNTFPDIIFDKEHTMVISPDEGGMNRAIAFASMIGLDLGMFYKRRDYSIVEHGRNPIVSHEFLGDNVEGKDVIVVEDIIASGESALDIFYQLTEKKAKRIFMCCSFGLFCNGLEAFDKAYEQGAVTAVLTTNLVYRSPELLKRDWFKEVDMSKYMSFIIDTLHHDSSMSDLLNPVDRIDKLLEKVKQRQIEEGLIK
ncbi:MAG TPA: ribose-phosphate pyrophosphokinase [Clostridia bacterium]|jgi:ribose-phosphate pyrophosphokinase|nr:ribose-phosphate pyrophosphokinase [Clostridia bacterium]MDD4502114.1 ribose-phosphate pyrophosphokinase [Clostridia bacterium]HPB16021.1 ribose-phosphate pyrophosphokinase [Clostridia bacterium]HQM95433.1 ribose-phosphate pyrophosphokinase [Clostridia bacterium]HQO68776.1 ribose-phosphate pyrophosphokinase [Clostridia bacterium]